MRTLLDWLLYAHRDGQFLELATITAHFAPADLSRYRHDLPDRLDMPDRPVVKLFLVDYFRVSPWQTGIGPDVQRVRFEEVVPSRWTTRHGSVELHGEAGGLIPDGRVVPGSAHHFQGGMNLGRTTPAAKVLPFIRTPKRPLAAPMSRAA